MYDESKIRIETKTLKISGPSSSTVRHDKPILMFKSLRLDV